MPVAGYIFTNWSPRKETVEICARQLEQSLRQLERISPIFSSWLDRKSKEKFNVKPDLDLLMQLLSSGVNRTDFAPRRIIEELGFSVGMRTDNKTGERLVFRIQCGSYSQEILNHCFVEFPETGPYSYRNVEAALKIKALKVFVQTWNPDWGAICSWSLQQAMQAKGIEMRLLGYLGWVTYVSNRRGSLPDEVRRRFHVEEIPSFGNLIYLATEPPQDETDGDYLKAAIELYQSLELHGVYHKFS